MAEGAKSDDMDTHTRTSTIRVHHSELDQQGNFVHEDKLLSMADEPGHQELCDREQAFMLKAINEDLDLSRHMQDAVNSLEVCLAADESIRHGTEISLTGV